MAGCLDLPGASMCWFTSDQSKCGGAKNVVSIVAYIVEHFLWKRYRLRSILDFIIGYHLSYTIGMLHGEEPNPAKSVKISLLERRKLILTELSARNA